MNEPQRRLAAKLQVAFGYLANQCRFVRSDKKLYSGIPFIKPSARIKKDPPKQADLSRATKAIIDL